MSSLNPLLLLLCSILLSSLFTLSYSAEHHPHHETAHHEAVHHAHHMKDPDDITVTIKSSAAISHTADDYICATLDWWRKDKCDYRHCPWGNAGILDLDLNNTLLAKAIKAFDPLRIRVGGSLQDLVVYEVGGAVGVHPSFVKDKDVMLGFKPGSLPMKRWDELNEFFGKTNTKVIFGLNELSGKRKQNPSTTQMVGDWDPTNARDFMNYTVQKGYKIDAYELGNELCGDGVDAKIDPEQYAKDTKQLRKILNELYPDSNSRPQVLAPGGFFFKEWFKTYLHACGPNVIDGVTHHVYNLGTGGDPKLIDRIQDPHFLSEVVQLYKDVQEVAEQSGSGAAPWVGEGGGAYLSGGINVQDSFVDGYWYLDQLGMAAVYSHKVYCRQAIVGGNYGFLKNDVFTPNPDYYGALLWHRLMGTAVLATSHDGSPFLRAYSHCSKKKSGVTLLLINMSKTATFHITITDESDKHHKPSEASHLKEDREEYHLTPGGGNIKSEVILLNGVPLLLTPSNDIPEMPPKLVPASSPVTMVPGSFVYVSIKDFKAPACSEKTRA
ncbi:Heparanase-like protein 2 [Linum grandiflorum]